MQIVKWQVFHGLHYLIRVQLINMDIIVLINVNILKLAKRHYLQKFVL